MAGPRARAAARGRPCGCCGLGALLRLPRRRAAAAPGAAGGGAALLAHGARAPKAAPGAPLEAAPEDVPEVTGPGLVNGFAVVPELETLRIEDERHIAAFSLPEEAFQHRPSPDAVRVNFQNGDCERMIHNNVPLDSSELESLQLLREEARMQDEAFYPSIAAAATRFTSDAKGDVQLALAKMRAAHEWRRDFFRDGPVTDTSVAEDMRSGVLYITGRDSELRPAVVVRPARLSDGLSRTDEGLSRFIRLLVFCIEYYSRFMLVPGRVENVCLLLDLQGVSITQFPRAALQRVHEVLDQQQACRVARFYVCNASVWVKNCMSLVSKLMTERQRNKLRIVSPEELAAEFAPHQLEEDLGGSRAPTLEFMPFPLPPGPFDRGNLAGPSREATPGMHARLSAAALLGLSGDPALGEERQAGAPAREAAGAPAPRAAAAARAAGEPARGGCQGRPAQRAAKDALLRSGAAVDAEHPVIEDAAVKQCSLLCCSSPLRISVSASYR